MARQKLGQHFLANASWRARIAQTLPASPEATWVEIGAGHGEMTEFLASIGKRVIAVETDASLAYRLRARAAAWPNVEIVHADILSLDLGAVAGERFRAYGNLPYYITSPILHHLFHFAGKIESIHVVIQLEVAARIVARPGRRDYGYLSTLCQYYSQPEILLRIPPGAFRPPPKVSSALVKMSIPGEGAALGIAEDVPYLKFLQVSFAHKRKTLRNNLRSIYQDGQIASVLATNGLKSSVRAEELTLAQFARMFKSLAETEIFNRSGQADETHPASDPDNS